MERDRMLTGERRPTVDMRHLRHWRRNLRGNIPSPVPRPLVPGPCPPRLRRGTAVGPQNVREQSRRPHTSTSVDIKRWRKDRRCRRTRRNS